MEWWNGSTGHNNVHKLLSLSNPFILNVTAIHKRSLILLSNKGNYCFPELSDKNKVIKCKKLDTIRMVMTSQ